MLFFHFFIFFFIAPETPRQKQRSLSGTFPFPELDLESIKNPNLIPKGTIPAPNLQNVVLKLESIAVEVRSTYDNARRKSSTSTSTSNSNSHIIRGEEEENEKMGEIYLLANPTQWLEYFYPLNKK